MRKTNRRVGLKDLFLHCFFGSFLLSYGGGHQVFADEVDQLLDVSLQDLLDIEVTSVSRRSQNLMTAPAAVYVITQDDLRRRGIISIPDALRMVPGLYVAAIDGNKWVVSSRGFSGRYANKLLVQIDGRSVYTPTYSGVYWDMQDLLISDIDRIEVIRGPGATLWGANAVNGVINILTKSADETQGGSVELAVGNQLQDLASIRYGGELSEDTYGRFYLKNRRYHSNDLLAGGGDAEDDWESVSGGFRFDGQSSPQDRWTLQGDISQSDESGIVSVLWQPAPVFIQQGVEDDFTTKSWNILGRWEHEHDNQSSSTLQVYWDHNQRDEIYLKQEHDTLDIDFQNQSMLGEHTLIYGFGYRHIAGDYRNTYSVGIEPTDQKLELLSTFVQGEFVLLPDELNLTLGSKIEKNDFTGVEVQPSIRLMWSPVIGHSFWSSISRAVRTPSLIETEGQVVSRNFPTSLVLQGNDDFSSEVLTAHELGYRYHGNAHLTLDTALFYNEYDDYLSFEPTSTTTLTTDNKNSGYSYGFEVSAVWQALPWWQLKSGYSALQINMNNSDSLDASSHKNIEGASPENLVTLQSSMNLNDSWEFDTWLYYVDEIKTPSSSAGINGLSIDDYVSLNARLSWQAVPDLELSITGNNLLDEKNIESVGEFFSSPTEMKRSVYIQLHWQF